MCCIALGPPQHRELASAVTCGGASSAPVTGITSRITAAARLLHGASCASAAMRRRAQRRCKCRRRPRLLWSRRAFRISGFPGSAFRDSLWIREVPKIETFLSSRFRDSRTRIAAHCDDPVLMYRTKSTLRNLPGASSTFFTNEIHLRCAPNFQFPVSHVTASPHSHISIHLISSFPFPFRSSQAASNQFPVSSFQSCNLTALQGSISRGR